MLQVDVEIKYEDLDDLDDATSDSDVDAVRLGAASANTQKSVTPLLASQDALFQLEETAGGEGASHRSICVSFASAAAFAPQLSIQC
jgi:hypothetical protein